MFSSEIPTHSLVGFRLLGTTDVNSEIVGLFANAPFNTGMGELHLEIILDRIRREYKIDAELGAMQVVYKERVNPSPESVVESYVFDRVMNGKQCHAEVKLELNGQDDEDDEGVFKLASQKFWDSPDRPDLPPFILEKLVSLISCFLTLLLVVGLNTGEANFTGLGVILTLTLM